LPVLHAGGIVVPVDKELKSGELRHVLEDCGSRILFTERAYLDAVAEIGGSLPALRKIVLLDGSSERTALQALYETIAVMADEWQQLVEKFHIPREERSRLESLGRQLEGILREKSPADAPEIKLPGIFAEEAMRFRKFCRDRGLCSFEEFMADTLPSPPAETAMTRLSSSIPRERPVAPKGPCSATATSSATSGIQYRS
jgi:acyl-CoA synthetase (AMP-forming)/AMP-acid ligase II